mmetsp:Transcript_136336/g.423641  ORF Transcript_136336/g.423641 Transcript_136336/m.423641 type:complete len:310 (+) Transcript_136336:94-1023(+)
MSCALAANVSCGLSVLIGLLWWIGITASWTWVSSQSMLVGFQANLLTVYTSKGAATTVLSWTGSALGAKEKMRKFDNMMDQSLWYEEAREQFCGAAMETVFKWCSNWTMVTYASWAMFADGLITSLLLLMGAGFMYYYSSVHATETGRMCCKTCFVGAPIVAVLGMLTYTCFTWEFGKDELKVFKGMQAQAMYGKGYIIAWFLTMMSFAPLYATMVFLRQDPLEKKHGETDEEQQFGGTSAAYYGGADPSMQAQQHYSQAPQGGTQQGYSSYGQAPQSVMQPGMQQGYGDGSSVGYAAPGAPPPSGPAW